MSAPPRDCPCGRPRTGGTLIELSRTAAGQRAIEHVVYEHEDSSCAWKRRADGAWRRELACARPSPIEQAASQANLHALSFAWLEKPTYPYEPPA